VKGKEKNKPKKLSCSVQGKASEEPNEACKEKPKKPERKRKQKSLAAPIAALPFAS
jgi:hypothetical protein